MNARGITIIGASAGSGKTFRLTKEVTQAIDPNAPNPVLLDGLVAVTFTRKAHAELAARIRHKLVITGAYDEALRLPLAYLGTVHAACLRLLQEFALDAGLSPSVDVVAEDETKLLRQALETALEPDVRARLEELALRVELRLDNKTRRVDWLTPVADIMDLARSNRIAPEALPAMAERSLAGLLSLLPSAEPEGEPLDAALGVALESAALGLAATNDGKAVTEEALKLVRDAHRKLADGELRWSDWGKLANRKASKTCDAVLAPLRAAASRYERHPRLHDDVRSLTLAIFHAARVGLSAYQEWKSQRRVLDYVDMLDGALRLMDNATVTDELARRLQLVAVDEFQDTSPIQLALFTRLHALAGRSVWVGDRKQCIFEYAGADPLLMDAVTTWVESAGGARDRLGENFRSRPELVSACNGLFSAALARHGFTPDEVNVIARRQSVAALDVLPPFGLWCLETANRDEDANAIAEGVRRLLASPELTPVLDRETKATRPVRPGDVAVLVATNEASRSIALALHTRGIRAATARPGLLSTPEGSLLDAALRWLLDDSDSLAAATLDALTGSGGPAWLAVRLHEVQTGIAAPHDANGWRAALVSVRGELGMLSPSEAVDRALASVDLAKLCAQWPDAPQRLANLDALRALSAGYESRCAQEREAATIAGLLRWFDDLRDERLSKGEMLASDDQHVPADDGAVVICTYHKAKGLEWPVVVLANLDKAERRDAFDVAPESDRAAFDPAEPLAGRWIRYWPWPFGASTKLPLADEASRSDVGQRVAAREDKERARLLYVGFTRARDHLVLAARVTPKGAKTAWLDTLSDAGGAPLVELPIRADDGATTETPIAGAMSVPTRVFRVGSLLSASTPAVAPDAPWFARGNAPAKPLLPYAIRPSVADDDPGVATTIGVIEKLPTPLVMEETGYEFNVLGSAVHAFLAADVEGLSNEARRARADSLLGAAALSGVVRAEALMRASDQLRVWVEARWPGAVWRRELPIEAIFPSPDGERRVSGVIDLLLETRDGLVLIDHKTFPGKNESSWRAKCATFAPQLAVYAKALRAFQGATLLSTWIHLPLAGGMVQLVL